MSRFVLTAQLQLQAPNNVAQVVRQIQSQLNNVNVQLNVQGAARAQRQLQQVTAQTQAAGTAADRMGRAFAISVRRFAAFSIATRAVSLFTSTLSDAVKEAIDFQREMVRVSQVTGEALGNLKFLAKAVTDLSTGLGVSSRDLIQTGQLLLQAGVSAKDTTVALNTLAKAALAPNFDSLSETTEGAIAILAQFGEGVGALEKQLGAINAVAGAFAVEAGDLIDVIRRAGGVFKSSGGDLNELIALFTSVRATTRESAESIGTGLRTIFTRIQRPKTIEFLKQFGVELVDLEGKFVGPFEAVRRLSTALAGLGEGDITFIRIAEELGGFRQIGKVLPLLQQFSTAQAALNVAQKAGNSLTKDAETAQQALAVRIIKVKEEFLALIRSMTETSTFQIMANTALSLASALIKIGEAIKPLLPLLAAVAAVKFARGIGTFAGGLMRGMQSGRTYSTGGKVHYFARGGMVPGTGNRDTVPAMLQPGEFVIKKSSVKKLGASNLAAMNENRYAAGGIAKQSMVGMAIPDIITPESYQPITGKASTSIKDILETKTGFGILASKSINDLYRAPSASKFIPGKIPPQDLDAIAKKELGFTTKPYQTLSEGVTKNDADSFSAIVDNRVKDAIKLGASDWAGSVGVQLSPSSLTFADTFKLPGGFKGSYFESVLDAFQGRPIGSQASEANRPFDFTTGLKPIGTLFDQLASKSIQYIDAKISGGTNLSEREYSKKITNQAALDLIEDPSFTQQIQALSKQRIEQNKAAKATQAKHFGGIIQRFAKGGMAQAPLIDDIVNATNTITPRPSSAIAALINAGGGAIDIDRTIKRTIGDKAYGMAKTSGQQSAALDRYFRDPQARLRDVTSAPLTTFGRELQSAIKSGQLQPGKLSIVSKSQRVPGVAEYLSKLFGIPLGNMIFTGGGSKQPAMDALRSKGPRASRVARFAAGGSVGTDTVPALLTPGEFVINKKSAQAIGYGSLNRMNKVGKYAKGGVVQRFAEGGGVTSRSVRSAVSGLADNQGIQREIAATSQEIKKTGQYAKRLSGSLAKQSAITDALYQESASLDAQIKKYDSELMRLANFQGKTAATGKVAERINKMKIDAETKRLEVDNKAIAEEQMLEGIKKKHAATVEKQTQLMEKQSGLIQQAKSNKQAATQLVQQGLTTGTQSNYQDFNRQASYAEARAKNRERQSQRPASSVGSMMPKDIGGAAIAISMVTASLQAMLPPLDENASTLTKLSHGFLGMVTTIAGVVFALQAFGVELKAQSIGKFLTGGGLSTGAKKSILSGAQGLGFGRDASVGILKSVNAVAKLAGPITAAAATFFLVQAAGNALVDAIFNYEERIKKAIESGNVEQARTLGAAQQKATTNVNAAAGASAGAVLGALLGGPFGAMLGASAGAAIAGFLSESSEYAGQVAATQAALVNSQKALTKASEDASKALSDFEKGNISATDLLKSSSGATAAVAQSRAEANKLTEQGNKEIQREGDYGGLRGGLRNVFTLGGLIGESTGEKQARIEAEQQKSREGIQKQEEEAIRIAQPGMNALAKQVAMTGGSFDDLMNKIKQTDPELFNILVRQGTNDLNKSFQNIAKEAARTKAALEATNLGLRGAQATSVAMSASMDRFAAGLEVGGNTFVANTEFLSQAMTSAAQAMSPDDIKSAVSDVSKNLSSMGISKTFTDKFEGNTNAFIQAQQNYGKAFDNIIAESKAMGTVFSADVLKDKFADQLGNMMGPNVSEDAKNNLKAIIQNIQLSEDEINEIMSGNYKAFGDKLSEAGQKQFEEIMKIAQERQKAEQVVIGLIQQRAEAERNLAQAQKEAVDLYMEGRDVQAKYGGAAVSSEEKRAAIVAKANTSASMSGVGRLRTGNVAELRQRQGQIAAGFANIEQRRSIDGGMAGRGGVELSETQKNLDQAQKDQVDTIRALIKLEEEELKIIQEKNRMEKDSLESLISGDVEKFFEGQASMGAQAAIAAGDMQTANMFGAKAIADAFKDIQRQQEAGVQTMFGRQIGGRGGLAEQAAQASLASRGVMDPRMAQVLAGTTPEEEARKATLRELGGVLGEAGMAQAAMAEMQVQTANINVTNAELKLAGIEERGRQAAANMNRGGVVYANRGIFVPRGTDTVPAMLTPGEFVVRKEAVNRGNNLQLLKAMNSGGNASGLARGGKVGYYNNGGRVQYRQAGGQINPSNIGINPEVITNLNNVFTQFISNFNQSITNLQNTKLQIKMDSVNVNVNLNASSMLGQISQEAKNEIMRQVVTKIQQEYSIGPNGKLTQNNSNLPR